MLFRRTLPEGLKTGPSILERRVRTSPRSAANSEGGGGEVVGTRLSFAVGDATKEVLLVE